MFNNFRRFIMKKFLPIIFAAFISYNSFATNTPTTPSPTTPSTLTLPNKETSTQDLTKADANASIDTKQQDKKTKKADETAAYRKAIDDFKTFLLKTKPKVREEVNEYRAAIQKLEKQKIELYKRLTLEAQEFLAKEAKFKKSLPIQQEVTKK